MKIALPSANNILVRRNGKRIVFPRTLYPLGRDKPQPPEHETDDTAQEIVIRRNGKETPAPAPSRVRTGIKALVAPGSPRKSERGTRVLASASIDGPESATAGKSKSRGSKKIEWEPIATFVVEFELREGKGKAIERRTRAHHHEATVDKEWPGFVREELCHWITEQLGEEIAEIERKARAQREVAPRLPPHSDPAIDWQVASIRLMRAGPGERVAMLYDRGQCTPARLSMHAPFAIELSLERTARSGRDRTAACLDSMRFRAHNRDTRATIDLGQAPVRPADASGAAQTLSLNVGSLPSAGSYRLECVPVVAGTELVDSIVAVSLLQVV